jgi:GNAT superfamily N-acetyltransferase
MTNALGAVRRHGVGGYLARLACGVRGRLFRHQVSTVFRRDLESEVTLLDARVPVEVVPYTPEKRTDVIDFLGRYLRKDIVERHLDVEGWTPMLGYHEGQVVALSWFSDHPIYVESIDLTLDYGPGVGYIEHTQTDASMQGKGLAPAIRSRICDHLKRMGMKEVYVSAGDDNPASQAVARKCGFAPHESVEYTRWLWYRRHRRRRL